MYCPKCGKEINSGLKVCSFCGASLSVFNIERMKKSAEETGKGVGKGKKPSLIWFAVLVLLIITIAVWTRINPIAAHKVLPFLPCNHEWQEATCVNPMTCLKCGKTKGKTIDHTWLDATCSEPQTCVFCGKVEGTALEHAWKEATCTYPKTCIVCGATVGEVLDHKWMEATEELPETCAICGETRGTAQIEPVYLTDMPVSNKSGKYYLHSTEKPSFVYNSNWKDISTNGWCDSAKDSKGNQYTNGLHLDGPDAGPYYVEYSVGGEYTKLTGMVASSYDCLSDKSAGQYQKFIEIYCDGMLVFKSQTHSVNSNPEEFDLDVTGTDLIQIKYATTDGSNDLATVFDAMLS